MIRLTLNAHSEPEIHLFNKPEILIGSGAVSDVDLAFSDLDLQPVHLKIVEQNGFYVIHNLHNDPFVSLNGHPFGRKLLNNGDVILIRDFELLFEHLPETSFNDHEWYSNSDTPSPKKTTRPSDAPSTIIDMDLPFDSEIEALNDEEWSLAEIESYIEQESKKVKPAPSRARPQTLQQRKNPKSLKDAYLKDLDEDSSHPSKFKDLENVNHNGGWKKIAVLLVSLLILASLATLALYLQFNNDGEREEIKVAQSVADVAMALTRSQVYRLKPPNQNWADVEFLKTNLREIIPSTYSYASEIDSQGQFRHFPYTLRIYTNSDLSHFLLIAQPSPSVFQWLIPKPVILLESHSMELRAINDVRHLNRYLATAEPMEESSGKEIAMLVKQGDLIPLASLGQDFVAPTRLAELKPGAENLVCNAPRYYKLGLSLSQKALILSSTKGSSQEVISFKQDVASFSRIGDVVLYDHKGKESSTKTREWMMTFAPTQKILFGYLSIDEQGKINSATILEDDTPSNSSENGDIIAENEQVIPLEDTRDAKTEYSSDENHPIYINLHALAKSREKALKPYELNIIKLLDEQTHNPIGNFQEYLDGAIAQYLEEDSKQKAVIKENLNGLYDRYCELPLDKFVTYVQKAGLEPLIQQQNEETFSLSDESCIRNLETMLTYISNAKTLEELENFLHIATSWLSFDYIKDAKEMKKYQIHLRNEVLQKLELFLLSPNKHLAFTLLDLKTKETLDHILGYERIVKPDEKEYFMDEFNRLIKNDNVISEKSH